MKLRNPREIVTGLAAIFVYALSFYWGLTFSPNYSADIYRGKLAIMPDFLAQAIWVFALLAALWLVAAWCAIRFRKLSRALVNALVRNHKIFAIVVVSAIILGIGYRGYLLAYTDAFIGHRWFWRRWDMAGHGIESIKKLSFFVLGLMLSPIGLVAFLAGLVQIWMISLKRSRLLPLAVFASGFLAVLAIKQLTVPYLYYYGRYLVSELVPLAIVLGSVAVATIKTRSTKMSAALWCGYTFGCFLLLAPSLVARLSFTEGKEFTQAMRCIDELTPGKSVILVDKRHFAEAPIVTPLRLTFDKLTFAFYRNKFREDEQLRGLFEYFAQKGYSVFLISSQTVWNDIPFLKRVTRIPALMRTLSGKEGLPSKARVRSYPVRIYSYGEVGAIPEICQSLSELRQ